MAKKTGIQIEIDKINAEIENLTQLRNRLAAVAVTQQRRKRVKKAVEVQDFKSPREMASTRG